MAFLCPARGRWTWDIIGFGPNGAHVRGAQLHGYPGLVVTSEILNTADVNLHMASGYGKCERHERSEVCGQRSQRLDWKAVPIT